MGWHTQSVEAKREWYRNYYAKRRQEYILLLGGKCSKCSSTENLEFDHKDRSSKTFAISKLLTYSKKRVSEELAYCQLLCEECHREKSRSELRGEPSHNKGKTKLTADVIGELQQRRASGARISQLSQEFQISRSTVRKYLESIRTG